MPQSAQQIGQPSQSTATVTAKDTGAFKPPTPSKQAVSTAIRSGTPVPQATTQDVALNPSTGQTTTSITPAEVPDLSGKKPELVQEAKPTTSKAGWQTAVLTFIPDGDTAHGQFSDGSEVKCRIAGIDTPEMGGPGKMQGYKAQESRDRLRQMIQNKEVNIRIVEGPSSVNYERSVCQIEIEGKDVSQTMVSEGLAYVFDKFARDRMLKPLEREAKKAKRGIWENPSAASPEFTRRVNKILANQ